MAKLYEINKEIENFEFEIDEETGEILNADKLQALEIEQRDKIENLCLWVKNLRAEAAAYKAEKDNFADRQKSAENKAKSLEKFIQATLAGEKFKTDKVAVSYRKSEAVELGEEIHVPSKYWISQPAKIDKAGLKKAIKAGEEFEGVSLVERSNMQIK